MTCHFFGHGLNRLIMNIQHFTFVFWLAYHCNLALLNIKLFHNLHYKMYKGCIYVQQGLHSTVWGRRCGNGSGFPGSGDFSLERVTYKHTNTNKIYM